MLKSKLIALAATFVFTASASAVELTHSVSHGVSHSVSDLHKTVEIDSVANEFKYTQDRDTFAGEDPHTGAIVDNYVVTSRVDLSSSVTDLTQDVSGTVTSVTHTDFTSIDVNGLTATEGASNTAQHQNIVSVNDGVTLTESAYYEVSTSTNKDYTAGGSSKPGNDVTVNVGSFSFNTEGSSVNIAMAFDEALKNVGTSGVSVSGQDLNHAAENGLDVKWGYSEISIFDKTETTTTGTTNTDSIFSSIK